MNKIKEYRIKNNISQEELARKINISLRQTQNIEGNKCIPNVITAIKIKKALNVKHIEDLFPID